MNRSRLATVALGMAVQTSLAPRVSACATCFGASDSSMAQGMTMGILFLLGVVAVVLCGLTAFFVTLGLRASRVAQTSSEAGEPRAET